MTELAKIVENDVAEVGPATETRLRTSIITTDAGDFSFPDAPSVVFM